MKQMQFAPAVLSPLPPGTCLDCGGEGQVYPSVYFYNTGRMHCGTEDPWLKESTAATCVRCRGKGTVPLPIEDHYLKELRRYHGATWRMNLIRQVTEELLRDREILEDILKDVATCDMSSSLRSRIYMALGRRSDGT